MLKKRGKRIRANDQSLIRNTILLRLLPVFSGVIFLFYAGVFRHVKPAELNLQTIKAYWSIPSNLVYFGCSVMTACFLCLILVYLYHAIRTDQVKQLVHRQKLSKMIRENGWYECETVQAAGYFKDLGSSRTRKRILHFPNLYYWMKDGYLHVSVEITMGKYQEQLLRLEKKLEAGLYCELVEKELKEGYVEYTLLYDTIGSRISIDAVQAAHGRVRLMDHLYWEFDALPHALISGGTGGGKTCFLLTLIEALLHMGANLYVLDPKNADLADLANVMPEVYSEKEEMIACLEKFHTDMMKRSREMKQHPKYQIGENYAYLGFAANFLIFDEYVAFMEMIGRDSAEIMSLLKKIVMLGRQAGYFLILACQRPDAKYFADGIRDQFHFRVALGRNSDLGYDMMFGKSNKDFFFKRIKGRGYVDVGTGVISEFYTPLVPKEHGFLETIGGLYKKKERQVGQSAEAACEAKAAEGGADRPAGEAKRRQLSEPPGI